MLSERWAVTISARAATSSREGRGGAGRMRKPTVMRQSFLPTSMPAAFASSRCTFATRSTSPLAGKRS